MEKILIFGCKNTMDDICIRVHIAPCVTMHCPYSETIISKIKAKTGVEVIEGKHPFMPENIYA